METDQKWIIVRVDGKLASVSTDFRQLASISSKLAKAVRPGHTEVSATTVSLDEVWMLKERAGWDDLILFGTPFQQAVWRKLFELRKESKPRLVSYSDFAESCGNKPGVRAVAHAIGLNPLAVVVPCHLVIPKETVDKIREIKLKAESTIFKGDDLCLGSLLRDSSIHFGDYALGRTLKRSLILRELLQPGSKDLGAEKTI